MNRIFCIITTFFLLTSSFIFAQSVPPLMNYQGMLTNSSGSPLAGSHTLTFNLYDAVTGGTLVWGPQVFSGVPLIEGRFNVILGTTDTAGRSIADAFNASSRYLGIKVDSGAELTPRQQILSAPYAIQAERAAFADKAGHHSNIIPAGTIVAYWGTVAPAGWLLCDGSLIPEGAEYDSLRNLAGATTPDLRGMFLRGFDGTRTIGSYQADLDNSITKIKSIPDSDSSQHEEQFDIPSSGWSPFIRSGEDYNWASIKMSVYKEGNEVRPKNIAVNYIIKY